MNQQIDIRKLSREVRGKLIFQRGRIAKKNNFWVVGSQTSFKAYNVRLDKETIRRREIVVNDINGLFT